MTVLLTIYLHGIFNRTGIGQHCEHMFHALSRTDSGAVEVHHVTPGGAAQSTHRSSSANLPSDRVHLFFRRESVEYLNACAGRRVLWWAFESDRLPATWVRDLASYDEVWLPSDWARKVLVNHGVDPSRTQVMELGVAADAFKPQPIPHDGFVFLSVGKYEKRKSINELIGAFVEEFPASSYPAVKLWLKADYPLFPERILELTQQVSFDKRILAVTGDATVATMAKLYCMADAFVFPSKAEGFGLPCIEALACGVPILAVAYSGQTTFLNTVAGRFQPIAYDLEPIVDTDYQYFYERDYGNVQFGSWAQPRSHSIRDGMREIFTNHSAWRARAREASAIIRKRFSWDAVAGRAVASLSKPGGL